MGGDFETSFETERGGRAGKAERLDVIPLSNGNRGWTPAAKARIIEESFKHGVLTVLPARAALEAEVRILNKDVGFIRPGQEAAVKLEAFPFTRFGAVPGRVRSISRDAVQDRDLGLIYVATITLERNYVDADGRRVPLAPGLAATVDVKTGTRRIISYLLSPLQTSIAQAGRER